MSCIALLRSLYISQEHSIDKPTAFPYAIALTRVSLFSSPIDYYRINTYVVYLDLHGLSSYFKIVQWFQKMGKGRKVRGKQKPRHMERG